VEIVQERFSGSVVKGGSHDLTECYKAGTCISMVWRQGPHVYF